MTSKEKAIEKAWEIINDKQPETTEEINLIRFAVNTARQLIAKPTIDDAIAVVEKECERLNNLSDIDITFETYLKKYDEAKLILTALRGLKEGK